MGVNDYRIKLKQIPVTEEIADTIQKYIKEERKQGRPKFAYKVYSDCLEKGFKSIKKK